jgi:hypothetical protein
VWIILGAIIVVAAIAHDVRAWRAARRVRWLAGGSSWHHRRCGAPLKAP